MSAPTTATRSAPPSARRVGVRIRGTVQGVGFRPYVFRLAEQLGLGGWVLNDEQGVLCEVEGPGDAVERFLARLPAEAPPLASIESVRSLATTPVGEREFRILASEGRSEPEALVCADAATCSECLAELADPADRRYRYPFTNCTNCGPRFSIVHGVPYDRPLTTMAGFAMCELCRAEYEDPRDRRFHAQPNACPECGPRVRLVDRDGHRVAPAGVDRDPIETAGRMLRAGAILAVKGMGGYHLACLAGDGRAVAALRARKQRDDKPFALMALDLEAADELVELTAAERALLTGRERPIVIARRRPGAPAASGVAPRSRDLGVMLPYTPLHHLLAADVGEALVLTSGNLSDEPIAYRDDDALARLNEIADAFLVHDRPIHMRTDDSVVRSLDRALRPEPLVIRRSRGYVPDSVGLPLSAGRPILGCGAELKAAFCVAKGRRAWVGHHIGDLKTWETLRSYREGIEHFERLFGVDPKLVAHDLHPDYLATRYALERGEVEAVAVQHHHAHLAACLAEHGVTEPAVGAIFDGAGYGEDGTVWGGELLVGDLAGFERVGALFEVRLPGGDAAAREPWRMCAAWLAAAFEDDVPAIPPALRDAVGADEWEAVLAIARGGTNSPPTTSAGRLFDAVAAICGVRARTTYEGQAATELEGLASPRERGAYPMPLVSDDGAFLVLDARETIRALVADLAGGAGVEWAAARFHNGLAGAAARACARQAELRGVGRAVLSGGVFQNRMLVERAAAALRRTGLEVLIPRRLPPNDGGIAYGQVVVAAARRGATR
jgi:hydrogenase maturation protein HypF